MAIKSQFIFQMGEIAPVLEGDGENWVSSHLRKA